MKYSWFLIVLFFAFACNNISDSENDNFVIQGIITNAPEDSYVKLFYRTNSQIQIVDSVVVKKSKFELKGRTADLDFFGLEFSDNSYSVFLLLDSGDNIVIHLDYDSLQTYSVENSASSALIQKLENSLFKINMLIEKKIANKDSFKHEIEKHMQFLSKFVKENSNSPACILALSQKFITGNIILPIEENYKLYKLVEMNLKLNYIDKEFYQNFEQFVKKYEIVLARQKKIELTEKPDKLVDFKVKTIYGKYVSFKNIAKNENVLLNFWASWCVECVENNQLIAKIKQKYPNVKIVQISLDSDEKILMDTLKKYKFNHVLINQTLVWNSEIAALYAVDKLPTNILINSKGEIVLFSSKISDLRQNIGKLK